MREMIGQATRFRGRFGEQIGRSGAEVARLAGALFSGLTSPFSGARPVRAAAAPVPAPSAVGEAAAPAAPSVELAPRSAAPESAASAAPKSSEPAARLAGPLVRFGGEAAARRKIDGALTALRIRAAQAARPNPDRARTTHLSLRLAARSLESPIAAALLDAAPDLAARGVRVAILLQAEPEAASEESSEHAGSLRALAAIHHASGGPSLEWMLRIAAFDGAEESFEQALIDDELHWIGARFGAPAPAPLAMGRISTPGQSLKQETDAARLRFAAAWRLGHAPSHALTRRILAAAAERAVQG